MATPVFITGLQSSQAAAQAGQATHNRGFRVRAYTPAQFTTSFGSNADIVWTAKALGTGGNAVTVTYVVSGANTPLSIGVVGNAITVNVATNGSSVATSTAAQVIAAVRASGPASALVIVSRKPGQNATGVVAALAVQSLAGGANPAQTEDFGDLTGVNRNEEVAIQPNILYQVDVDDPWVRQKLARQHGNMGLRRTAWIEVPSGDLTRVVLRSLLTESAGAVSQSFISRGFPVQDNQILFSGTSLETSINTNAGGVEVDLTNSAVRRALREHPGRWCAAAPLAVNSSLVTIRGLVTSKGSVGNAGETSYKGRGFRIPVWLNQVGGVGTSNLGYVNSTTNVQVDLANANVRRALRRNVGRWIVVSAP